MKREKSKVRGQRTEVRIQMSEGRVRGSGFRECWAAALAALLLAGCATPQAQFSDADWVSHATTGRGCFERGISAAGRMPMRGPSSAPGRWTTRMPWRCRR